MPILATLGADPCVIVSFYDIQNKLASLAHVDGSIKIESIAEMIQNMNIESTVAHLHGGNNLSFNLCWHIIDFIKNKQIKIENCALVNHSNGNASLAIDARDGKLYSPVFSDDITLPKNCESQTRDRVSSLYSIESCPLKKDYDGLLDK